MDRIKKQLHEWDENLKDESLPSNPIGKKSHFLPEVCQASLLYALRSAKLNYLVTAHSKKFASSALSSWENGFMSFLVICS